ncbi:MAG: hypothetical protein JWO63_456, partial [Frankiales bacterium]|nr:hypothetical protein [Frankiales bacterium]
MTTARFDAHHYAADSLEPALRHAAARATLAPSIHNTQPWRWVVSPDRLDLYADSTRSVPAVDPTGRQLAISCGAALFGARVALAAVRLDASTILLPDPGDPELLASITVTHSEAPIDQVARRLDAAAPSRHS